MRITSRENLDLMKELGDLAAQGRACGNLGNTNYLLGNFQEAIRYHEEVVSSGICTLFSACVLKAALDRDDFRDYRD